MAWLIPFYFEFWQHNFIPFLRAFFFLSWRVVKSRRWILHEVLPSAIEWDASRLLLTACLSQVFVLHRTHLTSLSFENYILAVLCWLSFCTGAGVNCFSGLFDIDFCHEVLQVSISLTHSLYVATTKLTSKIRLVVQQGKLCHGVSHQRFEWKHKTLVAIWLSVNMRTPFAVPKKGQYRNRLQSVKDIKMPPPPCRW